MINIFLLEDSIQFHYKWKRAIKKGKTKCNLRIFESVPELLKSLSDADVLICDLEIEDDETDSKEHIDENGLLEKIRSEFDGPMIMYSIYHPHMKKSHYFAKTITDKERVPDIDELLKELELIP